MKKNILIVLMLLVIAVLGTALVMEFKIRPAINGTTVISPSPTQVIVGGDRDEHGCIPSAGYSWCEEKQKCFRPWEESCEAAVIPTIDESSVLKTVIKQAIVAKRGQTANQLTITVSKIEGGFAQGGASEVGAGGGMWFAVKVNGTWNLVWDGNGVILCSDIVAYPEFPKTMIPECYDDKTGKMVTR